MPPAPPFAPLTIGEGLRLEVDPTLGRIVVATRPFACGDLVMTDNPLIVFTSCDEGSFLRAFSSAAPRTKAAILDMCHPPLDKTSNALVAQHRGTAAKLDGFAGLDAGHIHKLLMIRDTNSHAYTGHEVSYRAAKQGDSKKAALFERGSKLAHSCLPNCAYSSFHGHGGLEYRACRPIAVGDMVTFSYIGDIWTKSTLERRAECLATKDFVCRCPRCVAPDATCSIGCPRFACGGFAEPKAREPSSDDVSDASLCWVCDTCGPLTDSAVAKMREHERALMGRLLSLKTAAYQGSPGSPQHVRTVAEVGGKALSPSHYAVAIAYETLAAFCVHHATDARRARSHGVTREPFGTESALHEEAADARVRHVRICECIAAGCHGGAHCTATHPPVYECVKSAFSAALELRQLKPRARSADVAKFLWRYMPSMEMAFKAADVAEIRSMLDKARARSDGEAVPAGGSGPGLSEAEMAAEWLGGLGLGRGAAAGEATRTPRSSRSGGGKKGKGKR